MQGVADSPVLVQLPAASGPLTIFFKELRILSHREGQPEPRSGQSDADRPTG
jgi:hypothetical protein